MIKRNMLVAVFLLMAATLVFSGCSSSTAQKTTSEKKTLTISFNPGPYEDEFKNGVAPYLKSKGYTIHYKTFTDGIQPDMAVSQGEIDANVFQHTIYLNAINQKEGINLVGIVHVPTPPMGLYSKKHKSLTEVSDGAQVVVPSDPTNLLRAITILQKVGWITIKNNIDPLKASLSDVTANLKNIKIVTVDSAQAVQALNDADYVCIQGNYAIANKIKLTTALKLEEMTDPYANVVAVDSKNKNSQFANDIVAGYKSEAFQKYIKSNNIYDGYWLPSYFNK
ncbi:MetQ/NlpA family ABC transporter substrate-binding protein [Ethanoligenens harbinense]|uniref:NLPA lipoprotein n=1 Tax=Ethanoligenens harbinense (strain DSM 18485 / JCM 12961 / CGMCC 1.5033 / YUAN-3) TaxID=663278 RepID=E6U998_ETHHY|nr:MetQ/NlpA family ABC transporter substrate-binding protein [Ethanoligenens harbinense]ADU27257.1 NLPA lipoprotein [Ethanoligenens harbinense YUAN-3]AVQ96323.1 methionine-binding protein [Ethanoligenens harbinense YUAN-3]AYF38981.1 methionine-binding protein [Ethanoligenens harbinense]AYF41734.1 methionine-binding protein [Ethanoligenens harbinense]QCN92564.1 methionine-binding protein [Ethanoligenens harbinense]